MTFIFRRSIFFSIVFVFFTHAFANAGEFKAKDVSIKWVCSYQNETSDIPCKNFSQKIQFFKGGRVLLQDNGYFCENENRLNRVTYDVFQNKTTNGSFLCKTKHFDFFIQYRVKFRVSNKKISYSVKGKVKERVRREGQFSRQKISFSTSVDIQFESSRCFARRSYQLKETIGGIPKRNIMYRYVGRDCSV